MLFKTRGIVLNKYAYNDRYSIIHIYTEEFGQVAYMMPLSRIRKGSVRKSAFHPLSIIDLEVEHQNNREIHKIKETKILLPLNNLLMNPLKSAISIFLAEFIYKLVREVQSNKLLFEFIFYSINLLDLTEKGIANFHLVFMIKMSNFLGFHPNIEGFCTGMYFDMLNGVFVRNKPIHPHYLKEEDSRFFFILLRMSYENMHLFKFSRKERQNIIKKILEYYQLHLTGFPELKSLNVLQEIFE